MEIKIENYFPLVRKILRNYVSLSNDLGIELKDLFQEGCLGLVEAKNNFRENKNVDFSVYATYWIKKYILGAIAKAQKQRFNSNKIAFKYSNIQERVKDDFWFIDESLKQLTEIERKVVEKLYFEGSTIKEIAEDMKMNEEKIQQIKTKALMKLKNFNKILTKNLKENNKGKVLY